MDITETNMDEIAQEAKRLMELIRTGEPYQKAAKRLALKSFIAGMNTVMPNTGKKAMA